MVDPPRLGKKKLVIHMSKEYEHQERNTQYIDFRQFASRLLGFVFCHAIQIGICRLHDIHFVDLPFP